MNIFISHCFLSFARRQHLQKCFLSLILLIHYSYSTNRTWQNLLMSVQVGSAVTVIYLYNQSNQKKSSEAPHDKACHNKSIIATPDKNNTYHSLSV